RDREAALEIAIVPDRARDLWVDELVDLTLDLDHTTAQRLAELRRGEPDAGCRPHRICQVVEQLVEALPEAVDRQPFQPEARIAEHDDGSDAHGPSISRAPARPAGGLEKRLGVDVDRPGRLEAAVEQRHRVGTTKNGVPPPTLGAAG